MDELNPEARRMLELVRQAREPKPADKERMSALLAGSLALGTAATAESIAPAAAHAATKGSIKGATASFGVKTIVTAAVIGATGLGFVVWNATKQAPSRAREQAAPSAPAATPPAFQEPAQAMGSQQPARSDEGSEAKGTLHDQELDLLHSAQIKWRSGDARGALVQLEQHKARFPSSQLASERDALTAVSLCALGRREEGRALAERFVRQAPRSPLRATVEESCLQ